jgi:hypothetical protein
MTIARRSKHEAKSVSADIQVLRINLHRGSLNSIDRKSVIKFDLRLQAPAILEIGRDSSNEK